MKDLEILQAVFIACRIEHIKLSDLNLFNTTSVIHTTLDKEICDKFFLKL